jgi:hypothetical protein
MKTTKKTLIIDRSKWRTGGDEESKNRTGKGKTKLLNGYGSMCCLGFDAKRCGIPLKNLLGVAQPEGIIKKYVCKIPHLIKSDGLFETDVNTKFAERAMDINDDDYLTPKDRELRIKKHFKTIGINVKFINKYNN